MKVITKNLEFNTESSTKRKGKSKLNYVWVGVLNKTKFSGYAGTIETRTEANKLIKLLKNVRFLNERRKTGS